MYAKVLTTRVKKNLKSPRFTKQKSTEKMSDAGKMEK